MAISTNGTIITRLAGALYNEYLSNASYTELNATAASTVAGNMLTNDFAGKTDAQLAKTILTNLGLTSIAGLDNWVAAQLTAAGSTAAAKGAKLVSMLNDYAMMTADTTYGTYATSFNSKVSSALVLSQTEGNAGGAFATAGAVATGGGTFTLSTGTDVADNISATRGTLNSTFKFTASDDTVEASVGTLNALDMLLDSSTTDNDVINVTGTTGAFTASNIETINLKAPVATTLDLTNVAGVKNVNLSGTNTITVSGFAAATVQPTIALTDITRVVTVTPTTFDGTTTAGTAETLNFAVSGLSYGTTASTQSGLTIGNTTAGSIEAMNIASNGSKVNDFAFSNESDQPVTKMSITGAADLTLRTTSALISGVTVDATANTGVVTLRVERNGETTAATNAANWTGVDNILVTDSDATTDAAIVSALASGSKVTLGTSFAGNSVLSVQGATDTSVKDSITVELKTTATTAVGINSTKLDVQNVKTLNLISNGNPTSSSTTGSNVLDDLVGDFTTITITGDTSLEGDLNIDATYGAAATTARTVVVNASGMTGEAFVNFYEITDSTKVSYNVTGTAKADTVSFAGSTVANTVDGGAGNDILTGANANDGITGGDGNDTINISYGTDNVTGGAGNDLIDINATSASAVAQVTNSKALTYVTGTDVTTAWGTGDIISLTIGGINYQSAKFDSTSTLANGIDLVAATFVTDFASSILAATSVTLTYTSASDTFVLTGKSDGTAFTAAWATSDISATPDTIASATATTGNTTGVAALAVNTSITDFAVGDVINTEGLTGLATGGYYEGAVTSMVAATTYGAVVLTGASYADITAASTAIAGVSSATAATVVFFLNSTLGKVQAYYDDDLDTAAVTATTSFFTFDNITTLTGLAAVFSTDSIVI